MIPKKIGHILSLPIGCLFAWFDLASFGRACDEIKISFTGFTIGYLGIGIVWKSRHKNGTTK